ncbi:4652_t:CDS:1, partial [Dentiscutata heterogama]
MTPVTLPYSATANLPIGIQSTFTCMKQALQLRRQACVLGYAYYLGMLCTAATPEQLRVIR